MDYLKHKIDLYQSITGYSNTSMPIVFKCDKYRYRKIYPKTHDAKPNPDMIWRFRNLLKDIVDHFSNLNKLCKPSHPFTSHWPELFLPKLPGVLEVIPEGSRWYAITDNDTSYVLPEDIPYWLLSPEVGTLVQTEIGWEKKFPIILDPLTFQILAKAHIPGNYDPHIIDYIKRF